MTENVGPTIIMSNKYIFIPCVLHGAVSITAKVLQSQVYLPPINQRQQTATDTGHFNICATGLQHINFILRQNSHGVNWLFVIRLISYQSIFTWLCAEWHRGVHATLNNVPWQYFSVFAPHEDGHEKLF